MLGGTTFLRRTPRGVQRLTRTARRPSEKCATTTSRYSIESPNWLDMKLQQIDQKLSQIRTYISEESSLESSN